MPKIMYNTPRNLTCQWGEQVSNICLPERPFNHHGEWASTPFEATYPQDYIGQCLTLINKLTTH